MFGRIVFLGSNPSIKSDSLQPFWHNTKSMKTLSSWIDSIDTAIYVMDFLNVSNLPTPGNRPLKVSEIRNNLTRLSLELQMMQPDKIVALGKTASKALTLLHIPHYAMEHPSGLNRNLNNKEYMAVKLEELKQYIQSDNDDSV